MPDQCDGDDAPNASLPFFAKCADCGHIWPAAYYPMELAKIAKILLAAMCPKCGASGDRILVADQHCGERADD